MTPFQINDDYVYKIWLQFVATGCHVKDPIALRHRISPALPISNIR